MITSNYKIDTFTFCSVPKYKHNRRISHHNYHCHCKMLLLRSSISNTKKFLQKVTKSFNSFFFFCQGYQKLPKTPPQFHFSCSETAASVNNQSYKDLEKFYSDFTEQWDSEKEKKRRRTKKKAALPSAPAKQEENKVDNNVSFINASPALQKKNQMEKIEECEEQEDKRSLTHQRRKQKDSTFNCVVEKKLRELEMLDKNNVDYALDIEEVLHYYSRLTCPTYLEIVDKFFMEMCSEFLSGPVRPGTPPSVNSKMNLISVRS